MSDESVVRGGGDELEIAGEVGDLWKVDLREDMVGGGIHNAGEPESRGDSVNSKGIGDVESSERLA